MITAGLLTRKLAREEQKATKLASGKEEAERGLGELQGAWVSYRA